MDGALSPALPPRCTAIVVMGVSGCGKSSVAEACAKALGWEMREGDAYHSPQSVAKMRAGQALTDGDRGSWLDQLAALLSSDAQAAAAGTAAGMVLSCSALRRRYRDRLRVARPDLGFIFLKLDYESALQRVRTRSGHLFPPTLVASQFETLESPEGEAGVFTVDATAPLDEVVAHVLQQLALARSPAVLSQQS